LGGGSNPPKWLPPKWLPHKFSTLVQHISAVAVVNIVTVLSRSVALFHLKRSVTPKKEKAFATGGPPGPGWRAYDAPPDPSRLQRGTEYPFPNPHPLNAFGVSISVNPSNICSAYGPDGTV